MKEQRAWLDDYALFSVLHARFNASWPTGRTVRAIAVGRVGERPADEHRDGMLQVKWLQWQLDSQWASSAPRSERSGVELMGDQPFTVAMDSADVVVAMATSSTRPHRASRRSHVTVGHDWGLPVFNWPP